MVSEMRRMSGNPRRARHIGVTVMLVVCGAITAGAAVAQGPCPEGQTASGKCVKPRLADGARSNVEALSQGKISYTAPPWLPSEDRHNPASPQWHEMLNLFTGPPVTSPITVRTLPPSVIGLPVPGTFQVGRP
jgi:hypothetical protein